MNGPSTQAEFPLPPESLPSARSRWRWWIHLCLLGAYPLAVGAIGWVAGSSSQPALGGGAAALLTVCGVELGIFALIFGIAWVASRASRDDLLLRWRGGWWVLPLSIGYSVGIRLLLGVVVAILAGVLILAGVFSQESLKNFFQKNQPNVEALVNVNALRDDPLYFWLSLTLVSFVVGGLREELWRSGVLAGLRKLWPQRFGSTAGQILGVALIAVIFGLGHALQGPLTMGLTAVLGFALGLIMVLHRTIWPAVLAHGFFDAATLALLPLLADFLKQNR